MNRRLHAAVLGASALALVVSTAAGAGVANAGGKHHHSHGFGSDTPSVVVDGLDNPRQLAAGPHGSLYVAESGSGGATCQGEGEEQACIGDTAGISKVQRPWSNHATLRTVVGGLTSIAGADGTFAGGVSGVGVSRDGKVYGTGAAPPELETPTGGLAGQLFKVKHGTAVSVADLATYEQNNDPDGQGAESNPYSVLVEKKRVLVSDAAANAVVSVNKWGSISTFHVFPNITTGECAGRPNDAGTTGCDFVPTSLAAGPHGSVYVTGLASEAVGEGRVVKLNKWGHVVRTWSGFDSPVGIAVRGDGTFYVSELLHNFGNPEDPAFDPSQVGQVTKVSWNKRTSRVVPLPAGLAIIGNRLYVSAWSIAPATGAFGNPAWGGQIWRMKL